MVESEKIDFLYRRLSEKGKKISTVRSLGSEI